MICDKCGTTCSSGVHGPILGTICIVCYNRDEWPKLQAEARARARPWELIFYVSLFFVVITIINGVLKLVGVIS